MSALNHHDVTQAFEAWILTEGNTKLSESIAETASGELKRVHIQGNDKGTKNAAYTLHLNGKPAGYFENLITGFKGNWTYQGNWQGEPISAAEIEQRKQQAELKRAENDKTRIEKARYIWEQSQPLTDTHPYLVKKGITGGYGLRANTYKGETSLVVPLGNNGVLTAVQTIDTQGNKKINGVKSGSYFFLNKVESPRFIAIAEGLATIASIAENDFIQSQGFLCVMGIDADNLPKVAKAMCEKYPEATIILFGDSGDTNHKGEKRATEAAKLVKGYAVFPPMEKGDFNDYLTGDNITLSLDDLVKQALQQPTPDTNNTTVKNSSVKNVSEEVKNFSENQKTATQTTLSSNDAAYSDLKLHQNYTKTTLDHQNYTNDTNKQENKTKAGAFVFFDNDGKPKKIVVSKAAKIIAEIMRSKNYAYNLNAGYWHRFNGYCWQTLESNIEPIRDGMKIMFSETEPVGFSSAYLKSTFDILTSADLLPLPEQQTGKIPFKNGLFDMATKNLEPITKDNAQVWVIEYDYHKNANCDFFLWWLNSAVDDDAGLVLLIRAFINACLTGRADLQKFLHLLGAGGTGKSTLIRLLFTILGHSNCATTDLINLETNKFETAGFYGKRLIAITDSDKYGGSVNVLKALTGQDPVRNERKNVQQNGTYIYTGMVMIASNEPLASTDYTSGLERRRLVIKFDRRIKPEEKAVFIAKGGEEQLHQEIPAIINWALALSHDDVTQLFMHPPKKANEAAFESLTAQNPVAEWITDNLIPDSIGFVPLGICEPSKEGGIVVYSDANNKLYPSYLQWCQHNNRAALAKHRFKHAALDMLKTFGIDANESRRALGVGITGIRIKKPYEPYFNWLT